MRASLLGTLASVVIGAAANGQPAARIITGTVVDATSGLPIAGAVVDTRTLTDAAGHFRVAVADTTSAVTVRHIGFQPATIALTGTAPLEIALQRIAQRLEAVRVHDATVCPGRGQHVALDLWQQARDGLLASVVAREVRPAETVHVVFERAIADDTVVTHRETVRRGRLTRAFQAAGSAADFSTRGYLQSDARGRVFSAPDPDVLLDPHFATDHCFGITRDARSHPNDIGLTFAPARTRRNLVDVRGVLWLDAGSVALRTLEFTYTNVDLADGPQPAGGSLQFEHVANGVTLIASWRLHFPTLVRRGTDLGATGSQESGGIVRSATWADGTTWANEPPAVRGIVRETDTGRGMPNVLVRIPVTNGAAVTDARGEFAIPVLVAGRYTIVATDTTLHDFLPPREATTASDVASIALPSRQVAIARVCPAPTRAAPTLGTSIVLGQLGTTGQLAGASQVAADWVASVKGTEGGEGSQVAVDRATRAITPDTAGRFVVCGVSRDRQVAVRVIRAGRSVFDTTFRVHADSALHLVDLRGADSARARVAQLATMNVTAEAPAPDHPFAQWRGFEYRRRRNGGGQFVAPDAFIVGDNATLGTVLQRHLAGVRFVTSGAGTFIASNRTASGRSGNSFQSARENDACWSTIYVDGVLYYDGTMKGTSPPDLDRLDANGFAAAEYYSTASTPPEFNRTATGCGTLLLWRRISR